LSKIDKKENDFYFLNLISAENYIDLDRMLVEKAGKFRSEFYTMRDGAGDGPTMPTRINKYDFSDPIVIEVKFIPFDFYLIEKNMNLESEKSSTKRSINTSSSCCINICCNTSSIISITDTFIIISSSNAMYTSTGANSTQYTSKLCITTIISIMSKTKSNSSHTTLTKLSTKC
jgi:hypothetical protein